MIQRFSPHHAITAPLGMMRHDEDGQYVSYADYTALLASHQKLVGALRIARWYVVSHSPAALGSTVKFIEESLTEAEKLTAENDRVCMWCHKPIVFFPIEGMWASERPDLTLNFYCPKDSTSDGCQHVPEEKGSSQ